MTTKTCTFDKECVESEDRNESKNLDNTVRLKESDISSTEECSPPEKKAETLVVQIADFVEEITAVNDLIVSVIKIF